MATRVEEAYTQRDQKVNAKGEVTEIEIPYIVFEAVNEDAALSAARTAAPKSSRVRVSRVAAGIVRGPKRVFLPVVREAHAGSRKWR